MNSNRKRILALSYDILQSVLLESLELSGNPYHDAIGRFTDGAKHLVKKIIKKKPTKKHLEGAAKALDDYSLNSYGINSFTVATSITSLKHHIHKIRKIKPHHIREFSKVISQSIADKLQGKQHGK